MSFIDTKMQITDWLKAFKVHDLWDQCCSVFYHIVIRKSFSVSDN